MEALNKEYGHSLPADKRLHALVDPTGDIDIAVAGPVLTRKSADGIRGNPLKFFEDAAGTWRPWANAYTMWIVDQVEAYFKKLAYNFGDWFPENEDFDPTKNPEGQLADIPIRKVGPFSIYRLVQPSDDPTGVAHAKIQVSTALPFKDQDGKEVLYNDHFMEILFWHDASFGDVTQGIIELPRLGLRTRGFYMEMYGNTDGILNRIVFLSESKYQHKILNHIYRSIFLINLMAANVAHEIHPANREDVEYLYSQGVLEVAGHANGPRYVKAMILGCPPEFRGSHEDSYTDFEQACKQVGETLDACGLRKPVVAGALPPPAAAVPTPEELANAMAAYTGVSVGGKRRKQTRRSRKRRQTRRKH